MSIKDLHKMTLAEIETAIEKRLDLLRKMVGRLYPSIIYDEIDELSQRRATIRQILRVEGKLENDF